jgi:hypothetical protein
MRPLVDLGRVDPGVDDGARAGGRRAGGPSPAVAGGVDDHADARREARRDEPGVHVGRERLLVHVRVVLVERARDGLGHFTGRGRAGDELLLQRRGVRRVGDEAIDAGELGRGGVRDLGELGRGAARVGRPAEPPGVRGVDEVVDVVDGVELVQSVFDAGLVERPGRLASATLLLVTMFGSESGSMTRAIRRLAYFELLRMATIGSMY